MKQPHRLPASTPMAMDGSSPRPVSSNSASTPAVMYMVAPTDRSIPPVSSTKVMPMAMMPTSVADRMMFSRLAGLEKRELNRLKPMKITTNKINDMFLSRAITPR